MRACAVCLLERIMDGIADSLARYGFRPISRDAGVVQAGPQSLRRLVKKAPMSKQSGERARPALRRFASDPRNSVELRRTLAETQQQLEHEQEGPERAESMTRSVDAFLAMLAHELRQPLAAALHRAARRRCVRGVADFSRRAQAASRTARRPYDRR
jgi:signal transduction histidine kinase